MADITKDNMPGQMIFDKQIIPMGKKRHKQDESAFDPQRCPSCHSEYLLMDLLPKFAVRTKTLHEPEYYANNTIYNKARLALFLRVAPLPNMLNS
jgi:hypothetical protein